jgi:5'-deoxynucleotidase YfbR-like HD superfamily hydrolase
MLMSLFHAITDFTPTGGELKSMISRWFLTQSCTDFHLEESLAKDYLRCLLQTTNATLAREFDDLWSEYKQGESQVARRVRDACACAYAVQDGNLDGTIRTGEELSQLRKSVLSLDLGNFMDLLLDEIKAPDQTESATLMNAITVGQAYWNTPSESFELVSKAMETVPSTSPLTFLRLTQRLAKIDRAGWVRRGISSTKVEKVSGHSWRMAILGWVLVSQVSLKRVLNDVFTDHFLARRNQSDRVHQYELCS